MRPLIILLPMKFWPPVWASFSTYELLYELTLWCLSFGLVTLSFSSFVDRPIRIKNITHTSILCHLYLTHLSTIVEMMFTLTIQCSLWGVRTSVVLILLVMRLVLWYFMYFVQAFIIVLLQNMYCKVYVMNLHLKNLVFMS